MAIIALYAQLTENKVGKNGLVVTWDIERITRADGTRAAHATGAATSIIIGRRGLYGYLITDADLTLYDYVGTAITADAGVDQQEVAAVWTLWSLSWHDILTTALTAVGSIGRLLVDNINAAIGSRGTANAGDAMALTVGALSAIAALIPGAGSGAITHVITLRDNDGNPIIQADVWVTTGVNPSASIVASGLTDGDGQITFYLDAGTYYLWAQKPGLDFVNPTEFEVSV